MTTVPAQEFVAVLERVLEVAHGPGGGVLHPDLVGLLALAADRVDSRRDRRCLLAEVGALWEEPPALLMTEDAAEHFARDRLPSWAVSVMREESHILPNR